MFLWHTSHLIVSHASTSFHCHSAIPNSYKTEGYNYAFQTDKNTSGFKTIRALHSEVKTFNSR